MPTFRDGFTRRVPSWLRGTNAGAFVYTIGLHMDLLVDMMVSAAKKPLPGAQAPHDTLALLSEDRGILRGPNEAPLDYALRLRRWRQSNEGRGGPYQLLEQTQAYFAGFEIMPIDVTYKSGRRFSIDANGDITQDDVTPWDIADGNSNPTRWIMCIRPAVDYPSLTDEQITAVPFSWNALQCKGQCVVLWLPGNTHVWDEPGLTWDAVEVWNSADYTPRVFTGV